MNAFLPADILLPKTKEMEKWAVIACDQFTSDQAYWDRVRATAGDAPSTINLILPEAELGTAQEAAHTALINETMAKYMAEDVFETKLKLYEIEQQLCQVGFLRVSKSCLVQLKFIRSLKAELDRKIRLTLENGEQIIVSRQYADELKHRLGVK